MNFRLLFRAASGLFLLVAIACGFIALRPLESGVRIPVYRANGTMAYIDSAGALAFSGGWDVAMPFGENNRAVVKVERQESSIARFFSRWIPSLSQFARKRTQTYDIDRYGNTTPQDYDRRSQQERVVESASEINLIRRSAFSWVLKDGDPAFPGSWQKALDFKNDDPAAVYENGRWGFIDKRGITVLPFLWDETLGFDGSGRACVAINRKWGVIDTEGRLVVPLYFLSLTGFDDKGMCAAELESGWGCIDQHGKIVVPFRHRKVGSFDRFDMANVEIVDKQGDRYCGWINRSGEMLVPPIYNWKSPNLAGRFSGHELLPVIDSTGSHLIDRRGQTVVAIARGVLQPVEDPIAPGKFWIRTAPYNDSSPRKGVPRYPFEPACYDQTGNLIWNDSTGATEFLPSICATLCGLISISLFWIGSRFGRLES